ncbi:MAG: hypothetical protein H7A01_12220 [Hahellaceae bacterium]|nr:hypothetical protein [Hahellaceae bacterium]MCP5209915.1 hypothetical protein [Hahellaceae bacterium]
MTLTKNKTIGAKVLKNLLVFFFLYGAGSYSISVFEYTYFNLTGKALFGIQASHVEITRDELIEEFNRCDGPLFGANSLETENELDMIVVRCGRYWPFYRYSLELPATNMIPGAFIKNPQESPDVAEAKSNLIRNTTVVNGAFLCMSVMVFLMAVFAAYIFAIKKDEEKGYKWSFHAFVSSILMTVTLTGILFLVDPLFSLGW